MFDYRLANTLVPLIIEQTKLSIFKIPAPDRINRFALKKLVYNQDMPSNWQSTKTTLKDSVRISVGETLKIDAKYLAKVENCDLFKCYLEKETLTGKPFMHLEIHTEDSLLYFEGNLPIDVEVQISQGGLTLN
jgi:hypothetical protein